MTIQVKLQDIIEGMEMQFDDSHTLLSKKTGEMITVTGDELRTVEEYESYEDFPEWQQENLILANDVFENFQDYVELPTKFDIHEYRIMEDFCFSVKDPNKQGNLLRSIKGRGAFRRFKDNLIWLDIEDQWFVFRDKRYRQIAIEWCEGHGIDFVEG